MDAVLGPRGYSWEPGSWQAGRIGANDSIRGSAPDAGVNRNVSKITSTEKPRIRVIAGERRAMLSDLERDRE